MNKTMLILIIAVAAIVALVMFAKPATTTTKISSKSKGGVLEELTPDTLHISII